MKFRIRFAIYEFRIESTLRNKFEAREIPDAEFEMRSSSIPRMEFLIYPQKTRYINKRVISQIPQL